MYWILAALGDAYLSVRILDMHNNDGCKLQIINDNFTEKEKRDTIDSLKNNKSPGNNLLPAEFIKACRAELLPLITEALNYRNWLRYGLCWSGWYCNPEQHELCRPSRGRLRPRRPAQRVLFRIAVPTTTAQTV